LNGSLQATPPRSHSVLFPSDELLADNPTTGTGKIFYEYRPDAIGNGLWSVQWMDGFSTSTGIYLHFPCRKKREITAYLSGHLFILDTADGRYVPFRTVLLEKKCQVFLKVARSLKPTTQYIVFIREKRKKARSFIRWGFQPHDDASEKLLYTIKNTTNTAHEEIVFADRFTTHSLTSILGPLIFLRRRLLFDFSSDTTIDSIRQQNDYYVVNGRITVPDFCDANRCSIQRSLYDVSIDAKTKTIEFLLFIPETSISRGTLLVSGFQKGEFQKSASAFLPMMRSTSHTIAFVDSEIGSNTVSNAHDADQWIVSWMYSVLFAKLLQKQIPNAILKKSKRRILAEESSLTGFCIEDRFSPAGMIINNFVKQYIVIHDRFSIYPVMKRPTDPESELRLLEIEGLFYPFYRNLFSLKINTSEIRSKRHLTIRSLFHQDDETRVRKFLAH